MTFAMVIPRRPISSNRNANPKFTRAIGETASAWMHSEPLLDGELYTRIIWFHRGKTDQDADNIAKRILDSLRGIVFESDNLISQCLTVRVNTREDYIISDQNVLPDVYKELLKLLSEDRSDVLYVEIGRITSSQAVFGPIDGGV